MFTNNIRLIFRHVKNFFQTAMICHFFTIYVQIKKESKEAPQYPFPLSAGQTCDFASFSFSVGNARFSLKHLLKRTISFCFSFSF